MTKTTPLFVPEPWQKIARELSAKLIPHTTSSHNVKLIADALESEWQNGFDKAEEIASNGTD